MASVSQLWQRPAVQRWLALITFATVCLSAYPAAVAQNEQCESLRQQLMVEGGDPGRAAQYARAAERQRQELARTQAYADQSGCGSVFSFFDDSASPQCGTIEDRIRHMEGNLSAIQAQAERLRTGDPERQAALTARYNATCGLGAGDGYGIPPDGTGLDGGTMRPGMDGLDPDSQQQDDGAPSARGGKPICVRTCDGGYFPLGSTRSDTGLDGLQSLCSALCPNTEAKIYTTSNTDDLESAVALDGTPYPSLPAAFKFQKTFDPSCTCKPPGRSWVQALAQAEQLLEKGSKDVTVTRQMSDDMARPGAATPVPSRKKAARVENRPIVDVQAAAENALGAQAPTAGGDSAGIASGGAAPDHVVTTGEGTVRDLPGPDGAKRRVRIIGPRL